MRKILISCGSNKGGEFTTFKQSNIYSPDFLIYAFEPEPRCFPFIENVQQQVPNITHIKKAVSTSDGTTTFNTGNLTVSGSLRDDKVWGLTGTTVEVEAVDFSKWVSENINADDYVIVTFDIEGSEYDVLEKMIKDNTIALIDKIYVEFHGDKLHSDTKMREDIIKNNLIAVFGNNFFARFVEGDMKMFSQAYPMLDPNMFNNIGNVGA
jgi:FkbM family methyltransferase